MNPVVDPAEYIKFCLVLVPPVLEMTWCLWTITLFPVSLREFNSAAVGERFFCMLAETSVKIFISNVCTI